MSLMQRRRALLGALSEAQKILPGTVIWENGVTGRAGLTILSGGGAWETGTEDGTYQIILNAYRQSTIATAGACVVGFGEPMDFSLCTKLVCNYRMARRSDGIYGAMMRFGLGAMPPSADFNGNDLLTLIPDESGWERTVPNLSEYISTQEIVLPVGIGIKLPMLSLRTVGNWSGGTCQPLKIWVE